MLLLLAQLVVWEPVKPPVQHQGFWQSCDHAERILEHRVNGYLVYEVHLGPDSEFGLYAFRVADGDHDHKGPLNLLTSPIADSMETWRGARQWNIPSLKLWVSVVRAGESENCDSFYVRIETKP